MSEIYAYTIQLGNKKYGFTSFHKSKILAKLKFLLTYLLGEHQELMEIEK